MYRLTAAQAQALYDAERNGVPQIYGQTRLGTGRCALGVLIDARLASGGPGAPLTQRVTCPLCGVVPKIVLVAHLNDAHKMTFSEIARKLGPDDV